ncbi:DUF1343 domain-containing protein [bacterium]|nr:DUF1343 domain-containing protein [bacterium]
MLVMENAPVKSGLEVLLGDENWLAQLKGKRVGLITTPTGVDSKMNSTVDLLNNHPDIQLVKLFGPEHGVRGDAYAGDHVDDAVDPRTGIPEKSLYGKTRRPPKEYLEGLDVMVYDIQDIGSRSYTYIYTMAYAMEACGEAGIPFIVLDRPNPCGPMVSGNILNSEEYKTFVGLYAIPYQYAMTPGEVAQLFNDKFNKTRCDLTVVPMSGYQRWMLQGDTGLPWVPSSPHIPDPKHAVYYNLTGIIGELPTVSIGVGYTTPFETIAAPWIDGYKLAEDLNARNLAGVRFRPVTYKPFYSRFKDKPITGVHIQITNYRTVQPVEVQIHIMEALQAMYPEQGIFTDEKAKGCLFDEVNGTDSIRQRILAGDKAEDIIRDYQPAVAEFQVMAKPYLIYD